MLERITKLFTKQQIPTEKKSYFGAAGLGASSGFLGNNFVFANNSVKWMQYYTTVAPVGDAVNKIADKASKIPLLLFAPDKKEADLPVTQHPFLSLLKKPNSSQTQQQFVKEALVHWTATGNQYLRVMGLINGDSLSREPVELYNLRPDLMSVSGAFINGKPSYYQFTNPNGTIATFHYRLMKSAQGEIVEAYIDDQGFSQLYHFKNISTRTYSNFQSTSYYYNVYGDAPLQSAEIQIGQFFEAAVYNYFLIVNGLSARKLISLDSKTGELLTQAQKDTLKEFIEKNFSGAVNSGKTLVSPIPLKVEDLQIALKDMDFKDLYDRATESVYRALNIPLPLINNEHTSMNNMDVSTLMFFDDGVLPQLDNFCENIFAFVISQRYKDGSDFLRLSYNPNSIAALQPRIAQVIKLQKEAGVSTINELRQNLGLGRIDSEGCDDIYLPGTLVPVGRDTNLRDAIGMDAPDTTDRDGKKWLEKQMRESKQANGEPLYSEKAISILTA